MIYGMERVAGDAFLEPKAFLAFAHQEGHRYGAFMDHGELVVATWHVDELIEAAKAAGVPRQVPKLNRR